MVEPFNMPVLIKFYMTTTTTTIVYIIKKLLEHYDVFTQNEMAKTNT